MDLRSHLAREQRAFLGRDRAAWGEHLVKVRAFLGEGLRGADPARPLLVLGAGSGLELPWDQAPRGTVGWDADPWSRVRTFLRHRRWAPWVFEDLTGGLDELAAAAGRAAAETWSGRRRPVASARLRLAALLPSLRPEAGPLRRWIARHRPGAILAANVMGQFGPVAEALVEGAFAPASPWEEDPEKPDPLREALDAWTRRVQRAFLEALAESGAALTLVHDRGVLFDGEVTLGPWADPWTDQLQSAEPELELLDPLPDLDVAAFLAPRFHVERRDRWLWPLGPDQIHVVEALSLRA